MVIPLKLILERNYDKAFLEKALCSFKCEKDCDIEEFLRNSAEENERNKETVTFLSINDEKIEKGEIWVDGYFSLALKVFYFCKTAEQEERDKICLQTGDLPHIPAYLIGQLGRADKSEKGLGEKLLIEAISYIKAAQSYVGGCLVYLDCKDKLKAYYEKKGFKFIQKRKKPDKNGEYLNQMYILI